jgi:hypothetical protein
VPLIVRHVERKSIQPELRALGLRVVGSARDSANLPWLMNFAVTRTRFLRREKLLPKSPEMLAALTGLASGWSDEPGVAGVLERAQRSKDLEIRAAATARRRPSDRTNSLP